MVHTEKLTETEIINRVRAGEKSLYELIVRRFNPSLYKTGRSYNYNHEDTRDLMQETFIDAFRNLDQFEGRASFKTWIIRIMLNNCYRKSRRAGFKNEVMVEEIDDTKPMFGKASPTPESISQNRELGRIIEAAVERLPVEYRMVFSLREMNGLSVSETADLLAISEGNVKVRLNRAKSMLRSQIEKTYSASELYEFNLIHCDAIVEHVMREILSM